jgi:lipopolysaccharide/colanic/teichoic acid biosynthesis glycosyltransferase
MPRSTEITLRLCDIVLAGCALLVLAPLLLPLMLLLRLTGEGEVFYRQKRVGRGGETFELLKFATMLKNSPNIGTGLHTLHGDPRVLPVGRVLRKAKLNELPQLWNVLKGDMSVIGPRPQVPEHFAPYPDHAKRAILEVRPGLSGVGSIVFRDEETLLSAAGPDHERVYREVIAPYKGELEVWFVQNIGSRLYWLCIFLTIWSVLVPRTRLHYLVLGPLPKPSKAAFAQNDAAVILKPVRRHGLGRGPEREERVA